MRFIQTAVLILLIAAIALPGQAEFQAGAAFRVITPDPLLPVSGGVGTPSPVSEKKGDLFVRALVLADADTRVAIVSVDSLGWPAVLGDRARARIKGIAPENILIGATHTHSAPDAYGFPDEAGNHGADLDYLDWCCTMIAEAVNEALHTLQPATLKSAVGRAKEGIAYNYYAPELYDRRCNVLQASAKTGPNKGKAIATLVNYAIHPEVLGPNRGILSPDLCGPLYDRLEAQGAGMALFMNSAQGGMVTADTRREDGEENTWAECIRIGETLADEALRIIADAPVQATPSLACFSREIGLPLESDLLRLVLEHSPLGYRISETGKVYTRLNVVNVGSAQLLTIPGEALPNIGFYLKRKMPTDQAFLFGLTNDAFGYILTKEDWDSFDRYRYITRTCLGEMTGEVYVKEALELVKQAAAPDRH